MFLNLGTIASHVATSTPLIGVTSDGCGGLGLLMTLAINCFPAHLFHLLEGSGGSARVARVWRFQRTISMAAHGERHPTKHGASPRQVAALAQFL